MKTPRPNTIAFAILLFTGLRIGCVQAIYDPTIGKFLSRDPIGEKGGINLYQYVGNSPVNFVDPLGLLVEVYYEGISSGQSPGPSRVAASIFGQHPYVRIQTPGYDVTVELEGPRPGRDYGNPAIRDFDPKRGGKKSDVTRPCPVHDYWFEDHILKDFLSSTLANLQTRFSEGAQVLQPRGRGIFEHRVFTPTCKNPVSQTVLQQEASRKMAKVELSYYDDPLRLPPYSGLSQNSNTFARYLIDDSGGSISSHPYRAIGYGSSFDTSFHFRLQGEAQEVYER